MSDTCKDPNDLILQNLSSLTGERFVSSENLERFFLEQSQIIDNPSLEQYIIATDYLETEGLINKGKITGLFDDFEKSITTDVQSSLDKSISLFGKESFDNSVKQVNLFLLKSFRPTEFGLPAVQATDFSRYPNLAKRLTNGTSITPIEVSEFISLNYLTPNSLLRKLEQNLETILKQLDNFYNKNFTSTTMGSFCALAPSIFGAVEGFFTTIRNAVALIDNVIGLITNFSLAGLINNLKKQILSVVEKTIENVKNIVENFTLSNLVATVGTFVVGPVFMQAMAIKDQVMSFFDEENIKEIKERVSGLLGYTLNIFTNPSLTEIQYLIYRFCSFMNLLETQITEVKKPLDNYKENFESSYQKVSVASNVNTARAVRSGALRYEPEVRRARTNEIQRNTSAPRTTNPAPVSASDVDGVTRWNNGRGDSRIRFGGGIQPGRMGEEGWTRVSPEARIYVMRVQQKFGQQLQINSGYRSPEYNSRIGGATRSKHMDGTALDVTWNGYNEETRRRFIQIAQEEGFLGIGIYGSFTHIDLGPRRRWGG